MKLYLAGLFSNSRAKTKSGLDIHNYVKGNNRFMLESFYELSQFKEDKLKEFLDYSKGKELLLDSGAFTFMNAKKKSNINFEEYTLKYASFIKKYNIDLFFELDIDSIVGIDEVERLRAILEKETGKKSIPVWHKSRGKDYFIKMCQDYPYVSIGGIVTKEIKRSEYKFFKWFINQAHLNKCKIHALGFTNPKLLKKYNFDSVDSTSWLSGQQFGHCYIFLNGELVQKSSKFKRIPDYHLLTLHNLKQWIKFQKYLNNLTK